MIEHSFTLAQALAICHDHQYLVGDVYAEPDIIACVAVSPLDPLNKYIFNTYFIDSQDPVQALQFYHGPYYDVMVISSTHLKYMDLRSFLKTRNIDFATEKYIACS